MTLGLLASLALATSGPAGAAPGDQEVVVAIEPLLNTVDGSEIRGCIERGALSPVRKHAAWIAFGAVEPEPNGWRSVASRIDCGAGVFDKGGAQMTRVFGTPYLIADIELVSQSVSRLVASTIRIRKLTAFDLNGRPTYTSSDTTRPIDADVVNGTIVPLLVASAREREAFGMHELFLRLSARVTAPPASYGSISVTADAAGMAILLDGGLVGRTKETGATAVLNVLTGKREVRVRDFSGREASTTIAVATGRTADVALKALNLPSSPPPLQPIGQNPQGHDEYWRSLDGAAVVRIPAGEFLMGSPEGQGEANERPQRQVQVSAFLIDKTEVTWRQYRKFAESTGAQLPPAPLWGTPDDYAVVNALWTEAKGFCEWVGGRLPTEAEWEKAARGTDGRQYPWGSEWDPDRCNSIDGGPHRPEPVGSFPHCTSPYGVLDMAGSVWEWVADWYADRYTSDSGMRDPQGPPTGGMRALRGGSWLNQPTWLRTAYRSRNDPASRNVHHGFRCVQRQLD